MRLSLAVSLLAVFTGHMTEAKGGRGKKGIVRKKSFCRSLGSLGEP